MNPRKVSAKASARAREESRLVDALITELLNRRDGRLLVWWLFTITKQGSNAFTGHALTTAFSEGEQNIGQQILARILAVHPAGYIGLLNERKELQHEHGTITGGAYDSDPTTARGGDDPTSDDASPGDGDASSE